MTNWLIRHFIKNSEDVRNPAVRQAYGMFSGVTGILCNLILFALKFMAGMITGAVSVSADAFNNLSDAGSSIVTFIGFRMAGKPADPEHPFGHGRIEYLSGLIVSAAILLMGVELFQQSVRRILNPQETVFSLLSVLILAGSICVKLWMALLNRKLGRRIESAAMKATAADSLSDCIATSVVLISLVVSVLTGFDIDGYAGAVVAVFVFLAGIEAARDTLRPLLGQQPQEAFVKQLEQIVLEDEQIIGVHDLIVHDYGPGRIFASLHAEIPAGMNMLEAHDIIDLAEQRVMRQMDCEISIHMDPVITDNVQINTLKEMAQAVLQEIDPQLSMHDFRVTNGPYLTNLIFDVVAPYHFALSDEALKERITRDIAAKQENCYAVVHIDKDYAGQNPAAPK